MKTGLAICALVLVTLRGSHAMAGAENFLNVAILELPARYCADIPETKRVNLLLLLSQDWSNHPLDYSHGWFHFYGDNPYENPGATSQLYLKLLPRKGNTPLVFVHMPKPFATGEAPRENQTFILERWGQEWRDVTTQHIPKQANLKMSFTPRRGAALIEVAPWMKTKRTDGRGFSYQRGNRVLDLIWDGQSFQTKAPKDERPKNHDSPLR